MIRRRAIATTLEHSLPAFLPARRTTVRLGVRVAHTNKLHTTECMLCITVLLIDMIHFAGMCEFVCPNRWSTIMRIRLFTLLRLWARIRAEHSIFLNDFAAGCDPWLYSRHCPSVQFIYKMFVHILLYWALARTKQQIELCGVRREHPLSHSQTFTRASNPDGREWKNNKRQQFLSITFR